MAKSQKCPNCGRNTFKEKDLARECSQCGAVGWLGAGPTTSSNRGKKCQFCESGTLKKTASYEDVAVFYCFECSATFVIAN